MYSLFFFISGKWPCQNQWGCLSSCRGGQQSRCPGQWQHSCRGGSGESRGCWDQWWKRTSRHKWRGFCQARGRHSLHQRGRQTEEKALLLQETLLQAQWLLLQEDQEGIRRGSRRGSGSSGWRRESCLRGGHHRGGQAGRSQRGGSQGGPSWGAKGWGGEGRGRGCRGETCRSFARWTWDGSQSRGSSRCWVNPAEQDTGTKEQKEPVWRNARTCLKPGIFVYFLFVFVYYSTTISSIMTAMSLAVMDRRCTGEGTASSLLIGVCICDVGECANESVNVFYMKPWLCWQVGEFDLFNWSIWCWAIGCSS